MSLRNKNILITAGPTWVPIDSVRVISNIASGETGIILAEKLISLGAKVTLLLGPVGLVCCLNKNIKLMRFRFFMELKNIMVKELSSRKYDALIHTAAVSDYRPVKTFRLKVKSGIRHWRIDLVPTEKIIDLIRKIDSSLFLVGFKFQPQAAPVALIKEAKGLMQRANLNLAVANTLRNNRYLAYCIDKEIVSSPISNKKDMVGQLAQLLGACL